MDWGVAPVWTWTWSPAPCLAGRAEILAQTDGNYKDIHWPIELEASGLTESSGPESPGYAYPLHKCHIQADSEVTAAPSDCKSTCDNIRG